MAGVFCGCGPHHEVYPALSLGTPFIGDQEERHAETAAVSCRLNRDLIRSKEPKDRRQDCNTKLSPKICGFWFALAIVKKSQVKSFA